ncbi:MAG: hypothetical protein M2R45_01341 [Verrucomicrobia subdivision 3 bacterium]|nr:hypothetical protein [Limisphaerales bacterium]MCS1415206.1 hypothetical protein [Limisphaerales bacterium]
MFYYRIKSQLNVINPDIPKYFCKEMNNYDNRDAVTRR